MATELSQSTMQNFQPGHDIQQDDKGKYVVYKLIVTNQTSTWFLIRRYSEFRALYDSLVKRYRGYPLTIPPKRLFGNTKPSTIESRIKGLNLFVNQVLAIPGIHNDDYVKEFFNSHNWRTTIPKRSGSNESSVDLSAVSAEDDGSDGGGGNGGTEYNYTEKEIGQSLNLKVTPEHFEFIKVVGKGRFGRVFLAKHRETEKYYAIKVLTKKTLSSLGHHVRENIMHERNVLVNNVQHPFLVALHYSFQTKTKLYFVLDYINGGELFFHMQREKSFPESRAKFYAAEIASATGYLHGRNIIFRDLKPENLLLDRFGHIAITDFGLAKENMELRDGKTNTFCGTPEYLAPEVLMKKTYTYAVDWWSLGCVLYEMIYGWPPFYSREQQAMYDKIKNQPLQFKQRVPISEEGKQVLLHFLAKDPDQRLGTKTDITEIRDHDFFKSIDFAKLEARQIEPPYIPKIADEASTDNIDKEFLQSPVGKSVGDTALQAGVSAMDDNFTGFTYAPPISAFQDEN